VFTELGLNHADLATIEPEVGFRKFFVKTQSEEQFTNLLSRGLVPFHHEDGTITRVELCDAAGPGFRLLRVMRLPTEIPHADVIASLTLTPYGKVNECVYERWTNYDGKGVLNGIRNVKIQLKKNIPSYMTIMGVEALILYDGQPKTCRKCGAEGHLYFQCEQRTVVRNRRWETVHNTNNNNNNNTNNDTSATTNNNNNTDQSAAPVSATSSSTPSQPVVPRPVSGSPVDQHQARGISTCSAPAQLNAPAPGSISNSTTAAAPPSARNADDNADGDSSSASDGISWFQAGRKGKKTKKRNTSTEKQTAAPGVEPTNAPVCLLSANPEPVPVSQFTDKQCRDLDGILRYIEALHEKVTPDDHEAAVKHVQDGKNLAHWMQQQAAKLKQTLGGIIPPSPAPSTKRKAGTPERNSAKKHTGDATTDDDDGDLMK
jgi:hypothetical protein